MYTETQDIKCVSRGLTCNCWHWFKGTYYRNYAAEKQLFKVLVACIFNNKFDKMIIYLLFIQVYIQDSFSSNLKLFAL